MFSRKRIHDKYVSWRKLFLQNWSLFKASRIGLVGLGIMVAFIIIAFAAPFMGLRDPLYWLAPETDTIEVKEWWAQEVTSDNFFLWGINGSIDHAVTFRTAGYQSGEHRVISVYVAEGDRLFSLDPSNHGFPLWDCYGFQVDARISTDPVAVNYGDSSNAEEFTLTGERLWDFRVMFGTANGTVYVIEDRAPRVEREQTRPRLACPSPANVGNEFLPGVLTVNLGTPITGIAAFTADETRGNTTKDSFVVGTADGRLYAYTIRDLVGTPTGPFYRELWNTTLTPGAPVLLAGPQVRMESSAPTYSPAFFYSTLNASRRGEKVYAGSGDGRIWSVRMSNGTVNWTTDIGWGIYGVGPLTSPPVVQVASEIRPGTPTLVYAATKERGENFIGKNLTKVYALYADTGAPLDTWKTAATEVGSLDGGLPIVYQLKPENGTPFKPVLYGPTVYVTTTSGWVYALNRDPVIGLQGQTLQAAASVSWAFRDNSLRQDATHGTPFTAPPFFYNDLTLLITVGAYNNGTADPSDDLGLMYVLNGATGSLTWKRTFPFAIYGAAAAWKDKVNPLPSVWFGTVRGDVYSYSIAGQFLAPLPPNWASSRPYDSGNYYILGTDARGRDIFSQLLWGSRIALLVGFASAFFTISIGVIIGLVAGFLGGRVESVLMRFTDVILVIPGLPLVIILAAVLGAGIGNIILVISIVGWPGVARVIRAEVLSLKERPFIDSARVTGASNVRIMFRHIAPNVAPLAFLYMTFSVSGAILTEAALSFIGLGDVNTISWGIMLQDVSQSKALEAWWWLLPPGMAITLISLSFFLVGRAFDEIVNPRLRKR